MRSFLAAFLLLTACGGELNVSFNDPQSDRDTGQIDTDNTLSDVTYASDDALAEDASGDVIIVPEPEPEPEPDPEPEPEPVTWPEFSGDPCAVNGKVGRCLPTASCDGVATAGQCPGPAGIQCCVTSCAASFTNGTCGDSRTCRTPEPSSTCAGPDSVACCAQPPDNRTRLGTLWNTYYYLSVENDYTGTANTVLNDKNCRPIATVPAAYSDAVCIEGSGRLKNGTVINYASTCNCGRPCPTGGIICWSALDRTRFPWGQGAFSNALVPMRSIAVDKTKIPLKTVLYLPSFDGIQVPAIGGVTAFTHDGCFRADDVGGAIKDFHIDIFAGPKAMWRHFETVFPTRTNFDSFKGVTKCDYLKL